MDMDIPGYNADIRDHTVSLVFREYKTDNACYSSPEHNCGKPKQRKDLIDRGYIMDLFYSLIILTGRT